MTLTPEIEMLQRAARALGPLNKEVVYVGGSVVGILVTDLAAPPARPTQDVDVVAEITSLAQYYDLEGRLRLRGFSEDIHSGIAGRWVGHGLIIDVMPSRAIGVGSTNRWYPSALTHAVSVSLFDGTVISAIDAPHFLATKLDAFADRGGDDLYASHDMEDVIAVVAGRSELFDELGRAPEEVARFVSDSLRNLLDLVGFEEAIEGHLADTGYSVRRVLDTLNSIVALT